jgi:AGZA family xanthine/uracil permease-like MFS transporter
LGYLFFAVVCAAFALFHRDSASDGEPQPVAADLIDAKPAASAS